MFELVVPLAPMGAWKQFIVFKLVPSSTRIGKTDKFPLDWKTGRIADAHNPAIWLTWQEAAAYALAFGDGHGVGFVLTPADPFWFIDVDECLQADGTWSPTALALISRFPTAAWEVSSSGRGLHGLGQGRAPTPRKIKYGQFFDLYTEGRFVALTGTSAIGDVGTDHTPALAQLVADYLTRDPNEKTATWTTTPDPRWNGNTDDDALIERMLRSVGGASAALGLRANFRQLWDADETALAAFWPETNPHKGRAFNASSADAALAQALAFWTGNDCERIERLMRRSALVREKWNSPRPEGTYLTLTILNAVGRQYDVLTDKEAEPLPPATVAAPSSGPEGTAIVGNTFIAPAEQIEHFKGCVYVEGIHRVLAPGGRLLKAEQFKVAYGGYSYVMDMRNEKISKDAWEAFTQSQAYRAPRAHDLCFRPERPPGEIVEVGGRVLVNCWWPINTPCEAGNAQPFITHLVKLFPDERDRAILIAYLAAIVQNPGVKFQWAPLIQGVEGNGKTLIITAISRALGEVYTHLPNANDLAEGGNKFTGWLKNKLFIGIEEIRTNDRRDMVEVLKPLITNARIEIQAKGQDQVTGDNRANIIACSNHKDAIPKTSKDRRWCILFTAQQSENDLARDGMDGNYMPDLWDWCEGRGKFAGQNGFAIINYFLKTFAIPDELNPATKMHRAPETTSTAEAIELSAGTIEQEIQEAVEQEIPGFAGGWLSSMALDKLLTRIGMERRVPPRKRRELLFAMGYDWHPALRDTNGRVSNNVDPDGGKTRLFSKKGHIINNISEARQAVVMYSKTQKDAQAHKMLKPIDATGQ